MSRHSTRRTRETNKKRSYSERDDTQSELKSTMKRLREVSISEERTSTRKSTRKGGKKKAKSTKGGSGKEETRKLLENAVFAAYGEKHITSLEFSSDPDDIEEYELPSMGEGVLEFRVKSFKVTGTISTDSKGIEEGDFFRLEYLAPKTREFRYLQIIGKYDFDSGSFAIQTPKFVTFPLLMQRDLKTHNPQLLDYLNGAFEQIDQEPIDGKSEIIRLGPQNGIDQDQLHRYNEFTLGQFLRNIRNVQKVYLLNSPKMCRQKLMIEEVFAKIYCFYRLSIEIKPGNGSVYISSVKDRQISTSNCEQRDIPTDSGAFYEEKDLKNLDDTLMNENEEGYLVVQEKGKGKPKREVRAKKLIKKEKVKEEMVEVKEESEEDHEEEKEKEEEDIDVVVEDEPAADIEVDDDSSVPDVDMAVEVEQIDPEAMEQTMKEFTAKIDELNKKAMPNTIVYDGIENPDLRQNMISEDEDDDLINKDVEEDSEDDDEQALAKRIKNWKKMTPYDKTIQSLELKFIPRTLPCRDQQKEEIIEFIEGGIKSEGNASSLYISGMPGTGKTATTMEVIRKMQKKHNFRFININGMTLSNPHQVYSIVWKNINEHGTWVLPHSASVYLDEHFKNTTKKKKKEPMTILLLDELDALLTKKQTLLYNLFDWPGRPKSRFLIIAIANTQDLPERFKGNIKSRLGQNRLIYKPYVASQIEEILKSRVDPYNVFKPEALRCVSMKIAAMSGDIRRALMICQKAAYIVKHDELEARKDEREVKLAVKRGEIRKVTYNEVVAALQTLFTSKTVQLLKSLRKYEIVTLIGTFLETQKPMSNANQIMRRDTSIDSIFERVDSLLANPKLKLQKLRKSEFERIMRNLKTYGLVTFNFEGSIHLNAFIDDIKAAYEEDPLFLEMEDLVNNLIQELHMI